MSTGLTTTSPRLYVGTYRKYNEGSIKGAWLDLDDYTDKDDFLKACAELHKDESDPEFMFQDYEGFPRSLYSESSVSEKLWEWLDLDADDRVLLAVYQDHIDSDGDIDAARDAFAGKYDSEKHWAEEFLEETGELAVIPERLRCYFDYEAYARDARLGGDVVLAQHDGDVWVFFNH